VAGRFTVSKALGNLGEEPERARASAVRAALADPAMAGGNEAACITATGGWMEDPGKAQWLAGVAGSPIRVPVGGAWPAVGAARLAAMTLQLFPSDAFGVEFRQVVPS
jgi:sugar (pentulose or hexulose) kinase